MRQSHYHVNFFYLDIITICHALNKKNSIDLYIFERIVSHLSSLFDDKNNNEIYIQLI